MSMIRIMGENSKRDRQQIRKDSKCEKAYKNEREDIT